MNRVLIAVTLCVIGGFVFAEEKQGPAAPQAPAGPVKPVVPGASAKIEFPAFPGFPEKGDQTDGQVKELANYELKITEAYTGGNTRKNIANTVKSAQYTLYSNKTAKLQFLFTGGAEYTYHLRNSRAKIETSKDVFRETYDVTVQAGKEFLMEQYTGELSYNSETVTAFNLIGRGKIAVQLVFSKKQSLDQ